uniref:Uncharacterized protein n=1 Tax=Amphimedon queenslandica TaxID=400682 RepID=A0A1X7SF24_AMPQE
MSMNMIYQGSTSQDNILLHQSNPAYIKASDIHIYDEIPGGQYEEFVSVKKANNDGDDANQGNQEDNGSYVSLLKEEDQDNGSYVSEMKQEDQDNGSYVSQVNQENQDNEGYVDTGVIDEVAQSSEDKGNYENIPKVDGDDN